MLGVLIDAKISARSALANSLRRAVRYSSLIPETVVTRSTVRSITGYVLFETTVEPGREGADGARGFAGVLVAPLAVPAGA